MGKLKRLKKAVIKEELVALTGDFKKAVILNQMIYWSERIRDFDSFIEEEKKRASFAMSSEEREQAEVVEQIPLSNGWIYKSAEDLSDETMLGLSRSNMGTHISYLVKNEWLDKRKNPKWKADKTFQYRVNLIKIQQDLFKLGYSLSGYGIDLSEFQNETSMSHNETSKSQNETGNSETEQEILKQNRKFQNRTAIPESTSESTLDTTSGDYQPPEPPKEAKKETAIPKEVVVDVKSLIINSFVVEDLADREIEKLIRTAVEYKKNLPDSIKQTQQYFIESKEEIEDLVSVLIHGIKKGWTMPKKASSKGKKSALPKAIAGEIKESEQTDEEIQGTYDDIQATMKFLRSTEQQILDNKDDLH